MARRYDADGESLGFWTRVSGGQGPDVALDETGNYTVVWHTGLFDANSGDVFGAFYNAAGQRAHQQLLINEISLGRQIVPTVSAGPAGHFLIAWQGASQDGTGDNIHARAYTPVTQPASVGDIVWRDTDGDGVHEPGELGIGGVTVRLYDARGTLVDTQVTSATGAWRFDYLRPGEYLLEVTPPSGMTFTRRGQGSDATRDNDFDFV